MLILGTVAISAGGVGAWYLGTGDEVREGAQVMLAAICAGFLLLGIYLAAWVSRIRLTLREDAIELTGVVTTRSLRRDQIAGYRTLTPGNGPPILVLVPRDDYCGKLKIPVMFRYDRAFRDYLATLPDLDAREAETLRRESDARPELGATPEDRSRAIAQARRTCKVLTIVTFAVSAWGLFFPGPSVMILLAILPWTAIGVAARYPGVVAINQRRRDPRPGVSIPFIFPGLILTLRVINDATPIGWQRPLALTLFVAALLALAAWRTDVTLQQKPALLLVILLLSCFYGFGVVMGGDTLFDATPPEVYKTTITDRYITTGRSTGYHFKLAPWGPKTHGDKVSVSRDYYRSKIIGDPICVALRPGTLGIPWYDVGDCR